MIVILCEIINFLVTHPLKEVTASECAEFLLKSSLHILVHLSELCVIKILHLCPVYADIVFNNTKYKY